MKRASEATKSCCPTLLVTKFLHHMYKTLARVGNKKTYSCSCRSVILDHLLLGGAQPQRHAGKEGYVLPEGKDDGRDAGIVIRAQHVLPDVDSRGQRQDDVDEAEDGGDP